ncbi:hypothetical protein IAU59_004968 [Kwoniella sp. CBS 9459]
MGRPSPPPERPIRRPSLPSSPAPSSDLPFNIIEPNRPRRSLPPVPLSIDDLGLEAGQEEGLPAYEEEPDNDEVELEREREVPGQQDSQAGPSHETGAAVGSASAQRGEEGIPAAAGEAEVPRAGLKRFGRWRDWVEKRANERDEDASRGDRRAARRELPKTPNPPSYDSTLPGPVRYLPPAAHPTSLPNTSLLRIDYGSALVPHSSSSIACALPVLGGRLVILGTSTGLRVLNTDDEDNPTRSIWYGLPVWDMRIIDSNSTSGTQEINGTSTSASQTTPKGTIAVLCGGIEDSSKLSRPKRSSGSELRLYSLSSLISLARYAAMQPKSYAGIDLTPLVGGKGKGKSKDVEWTMIDRSSIGSLRHLSLTEPTPTAGPALPASELPSAWSKDYTVLPSGSGSGAGGKGSLSDVQLVATYTSQARVFIAVGSSTHVIIHGCFPPPVSEEGRGDLRFNASRTFYLPAQPTSISFIKLPSNDLPIPSDGHEHADETDDAASLFSYDDRASIHTGGDRVTQTSPAHAGTSSSSSAPPPHTDGAGSDQIPSLGLHVSFGSKACLIRVSDSAVLDFRLKKPGSSGSSAGGKGDWASLETLRLYGGGEVYVLTRGKETFLLSAPFEIPSHFNTPLATVLWPESPCSISSSVVYTSTASSTTATSNCHSHVASSSAANEQTSSENVNIRLVATSFTGNLHIQQLTFSTAGHLGANSDQNRAKPFASTTLGAMAKVVQSDSATGIYSIYDEMRFGEGLLGQGSGKDGGMRGGGCFVRYKKGERDWRVVRLEKE